MRKSITSTPGCAYVARITDIVRIYDEHSREGISNREIFRRYIYPRYHICERTFYHYIKASTDDRIIKRQHQLKQNGLSFQNT